METIEIVKRMIVDGVLKKDVAEKYFPELAESEDEKIIRCICDTVRKYGVEFATGTITEQKMLAWLEKQGEQKPAEWSEEDEEMFGNVLSTLSICSNNPDIPIDVRKMHQKEYAWFDELYNRFYSQPQWKPSKEQIEALLEAAQGLYSCKEKNLLLDLYEQLKAL